MKITNTIVEKHGLKLEEYSKIKELLKREPNLLELGIFSAMWNEHCSYKSSRIHLKNLPTKGEKVIQGPGENAGVIDIGDAEIDPVQSDPMTIKVSKITGLTVALDEDAQALMSNIEREEAYKSVLLVLNDPKSVGRTLTIEGTPITIGFSGTNVESDFANDSENALARPYVIYEDGVWKMWFAHKSKMYRLGYAESEDGVNWERRDEFAVLDVSNSGWDSEMVEYAAVVNYKGQHFMFYNGNNYGYDGIGLAIEE